MFLTQDCDDESDYVEEENRKRSREIDDLLWLFATCELLKKKLEKIMNS